MTRHRKLRCAELRGAARRGAARRGTAALRPDDGTT
jgi:hypothetical protein